MLHQENAAVHLLPRSLADPSRIKLVCLTSSFALADAPQELRWLDRCGKLGSNHTDKLKMVEWLERRRRSLGLDHLCFLIDIEVLGGISRGFEFLRDLRLSFPSIPLIIFSNRAKSHDFSTERAGICDATLRYPFKKGDLDCAIDAALGNNALFQARIEINADASTG